MAVLSVNETTTFRWSFEEDVLQYAQAGIPAIGVWRQKLSDVGDLKAAELLEETRMSVSCLFWAGGFTGSDGRSFRASIDDAAEALRSAAAIKAPHLLVCSGTRGGHTFNHARRLMRDALKELAPQAAELGLGLLIEPMHPGCAAGFTFLTTLDESLQLIDSVGSPVVKLVLDTYHLGHDEALLERIPQIAPQIGLVQLGDARQPPSTEQSRCRLGEGVLPLRQIVAAVVESGYDGFFEVELLGEEIETEDYHALLEHAKKAYSELLGARRLKTQ